MDSFGQIAITAIGVLGSASVWKYFESRLKVKAQQRKNQRENSDTTQYRDDLKNRVKNLESLLAQSSDEKEQMRKQILNLTAEVHELRVKVEFLTKENLRLSNK
jgi:uncharacterized protein HemX|tara:strand:+ start:748 stop:1059 length:312 start_codon:yes stop_codon:yes gene_type:complete